MPSLIKNKKGIEAGGFSVIIGIALVLLSGGVILAAVREAASGLDENLQVGLCRTSNELRFGLKERTGDVLGTPAICNTIDKTKDKLQVPTSKYPQNNEGAALETRDMIKNSWHMWLEGSIGNMFEEYPISEGCFITYIYKVKKNAKGLTFASIEESMEEPFFAEDASDKCAPDIGGFWRETCLSDEQARETTKIPPGTNYECCTKDIRNTCENRGGKCSSTGSTPDYPSLTNMWSCPGRGESCYVGENEHYSYTNYIRKSTPRGGEVFFMPPGEEEVDNIKYIPGEIYTISFVSPSSVYCFDADAKTDCVASAGNGWYVPVVIGGAGLAAWFFGPAAVAGFIGRTTLEIAMLSPLIAGSAAFLFIDDALLSGAEWLASPITSEAPNFIIVSTLEQAQELGCTAQYAG